MRTASVHLQRSYKTSTELFVTWVPASENWQTRSRIPWASSYLYHPPVTEPALRRSPERTGVVRHPVESKCRRHRGRLSFRKELEGSGEIGTRRCRMILSWYRKFQMTISLFLKNRNRIRVRMVRMVVSNYSTVCIKTQICRLSSLENTSRSSVLPTFRQLKRTPKILWKVRDLMLPVIIIP